MLGDSVKNYGMNNVCSGTIMVYFMAYQACVTINWALVAEIATTFTDIQSSRKASKSNYVLQEKMYHFANYKIDTWKNS